MFIVGIIHIDVRKSGKWRNQEEGGIILNQQNLCALVSLAWIAYLKLDRSLSQIHCQTRQTLRFFLVAHLGGPQKTVAVRGRKCSGNPRQLTRCHLTVFPNRRREVLVKQTWHAPYLPSRRRTFTFLKEKNSEEQNHVWRRRWRRGLSYSHWRVSLPKRLYLSYK